MSLSGGEKLTAHADSGYKVRVNFAKAICRHYGKICQKRLRIGIKVESVGGKYVK